MLRPGRRGFQPVDQILDSHEAPSALLAVKRLVNGDPRQPRRKAGAAEKLVKVRKRSHVGILQNVLRLGLVTKNRAHNSIEALVVTPHEDLEQVCMAASHPVDDLFVTEIGTRDAKRAGLIGHRAAPLLGHERPPDPL
jgi:hypothetical protein